MHIICTLYIIHVIYIRSDQISRSVVSDSLWPHESQHARPPCPLKRHGNSNTPTAMNTLTTLRTYIHTEVSQSCPTLRLRKLQHTRPPCPLLTPGVYSNSHPLSRWCHPTISSSVVPFSSRLQSFPASGSFQISQFITSGGPSIGVSASASVLPMNIQD